MKRMAKLLVILLLFHKPLIAQIILPKQCLNPNTNTFSTIITSPKDAGSPNYGYDDLGISGVRDGNKYVILGQSSAPAGGFLTPNTQLITLDNNGDEVSSFVHNKNHENVSLNRDYPKQMIASFCSEKGYIVTGHSTNDLIFEKITTANTVEFDYSFTTNETLKGEFITESDNGDFLFGGTSFISGGNRKILLGFGNACDSPAPVAFQYDFGEHIFPEAATAIKLGSSTTEHYAITGRKIDGKLFMLVVNKSGNIVAGDLLPISFGSEAHSGYDIIQKSNGDIGILGQYNNKIFILELRYNNEENTFIIIRSKLFDIPDSDLETPSAFIINHEGNYVISGTGFTNLVGGVQDNNSPKRGIILEVNEESLSVKWAKEYIEESYAFSSFSDIVIAPNGYFCVGSTGNFHTVTSGNFSFIKGINDVYAVKTDENGQFFDCDCFEEIDIITSNPNPIALNTLIADKNGLTIENTSYSADTIEMNQDFCDQYNCSTIPWFSIDFNISYDTTTLCSNNDPVVSIIPQLDDFYPDYFDYDLDCDGVYEHTGKLSGEIINHQFGGPGIYDICIRGKKVLNGEEVCDTIWTLSVQIICPNVPGFFECGQAVVTCFSSDRRLDHYDPTRYVIGMIDVRDRNSVHYDPPRNLQSNFPGYHHPSWTAENLGEIFGIATDLSSNIYTTATTMYPIDNFGTNVANTGGEVHQIAPSGIISLLVRLPNTGEGLGNVCYAKAPDGTNLLFVTNWENGFIYRINLDTYNGDPNDATNWTSYDAFDMDDVSKDYAPLGQLTWGIGYNAIDNKLYVGRWMQNAGDVGDPNNCTMCEDEINFSVGLGSNEIHSINLTNSAEFVTNTTSLVFTLPQTHLSNGPGSPLISNPVSDIAFSANGKMLFSERSMCCPTEGGAHRANVMELEKSGSTWHLSPATFHVGPENNTSNDNSAGGIDYGYDDFSNTNPDSLPNCDSIVWATGDIPLIDIFGIYGIVGMPATGNDIADVNSYFINIATASNRGIQKRLIGDVEIFKCGCNEVQRNCENLDWSNIGFDIQYDTSTLCNGNIPNVTITPNITGNLVPNTLDYDLDCDGVYDLTGKATTDIITHQFGDAGIYPVCIKAKTTTAGGYECDTIFTRDIRIIPCCTTIPNQGKAVISCFSGFINNTPNQGVDNSAPVLGIVDIRNHDTAPRGSNWAAANKTSSPDWNATNMGQIFGLAIDSDGDIFATATSVYGTDYDYGPAGPGGIYRIDGATYAINNFMTTTTSCDDPIVSNKIPNQSPTTNPKKAPALGNICYDSKHDQFFVTNHEDGKIYRIQNGATTGTILNVYTPSFNTSSCDSGFVPLEERLWGIAYNPVENRVYFSRWVEDTNNENPILGNEVWSLLLDSSGNFILGSEIREIDMNETILHFSPGDTNPISDIAFSNDGTIMIIGEKTMSDGDDLNLMVLSASLSHAARVIEFTGNSGTWNLNPFGINKYQVGANGNSTSGGIDFGYNSYLPSNNQQLYCDEMIWSTGDALSPNHGHCNNKELLYGIWGTNTTTGGNSSNSVLIDVDNDLCTFAKAEFGDLEIFKCGCGGESVFDCSEVDIAAESIDNPDGLCCYSFDIINNTNGIDISQIDVELLNTDWTINLGSLMLNSGLSWACTPMNNQVCIENSTGSSISSISDALQLCLAPIGSNPSTTQQLVFSWLETIGESEQVVCRDTVTLNCMPPVGADPCLEIIEPTITCNPANANEYFYKLKVKNTSSIALDAYKVVLEDLSLNSIGFRPCSATTGSFPIIDVLMDPFPLAPDAISNELCIKLESSQPILETTNICFSVGLDFLSGCCNAVEEVCADLEPCCDPCEDISISTAVINPESDECCYALGIQNNCEYDIFTKIETEILTPGVEFGYHAIGGTNASYWTACGSSKTSVCWQPIGTTIPSGNIDDLMQFCLSGIDEPAKVPQIVSVKFYSLDANNNEVVTCTKTLEFNCPSITNYDCLEITNATIDCDLPNQKYNLSFNVTNQSTLPFTATAMDATIISPSDLYFDPTGIMPLNPSLNKGETSAMLNACIKSHSGAFPSTATEIAVNFRLRYEEGDTCCYEYILDTIPLPTCSAPDSVTIKIEDASTTCGDEFCVDIKVRDFYEILTMQASIAYDPYILQFNRIQQLNLSHLSMGSFNTSNVGSIEFAWFDNAASGVSVPDETSIFQLCFDVIATNTTSTTLTWNDSPLVREVTNASKMLDFKGINGQININCNEPCPPDYIAENKLTGIQAVDATYVTDGNLETEQIIENNVNVIYDAKIAITLLSGFEVKSGGSLHAFIDGCGEHAPDDDGPPHSFINSTNIVQTAKETISVYPNPTESAITVEYNIENTQEVNIYLADFSGRIVKSFNLNTQDKGIYYQQIDFGANLPQGLYYVILPTENGVLTEKVLYQQY